MLRHILSFAGALLVTIAITAAAAAQEDNDATRGRQMIHRAQQAFGGADKLAAIRDFTQIIEVAMETLPGGVKAKQSNRYLAPGVYRQDEDMPFGKISSYVDGESGWRSTSRGSLIMPTPVLKMAHDELFRNLFVVMAADRDSSVNVKAVGSNTVQISKADGFSVKLEFDASSGLPLRKVYVASDPHGPPTEIEEFYSDWREVEGLKVPFKMTIRQDGKKLADETVQEFKFNTGLKAEDLSQKP